MGQVQLSEVSEELVSFAVVAEDHGALRWIIDPKSGSVIHAGGDVDAVLTGTAEDLVLTIAGEENLGVLTHSDRLRHLLADEDEANRHARHEEISAVVTLLRSSIGERPSEDI